MLLDLSIFRPFKAFSNASTNKWILIIAADFSYKERIKEKNGYLFLKVRSSIPSSRDCGRIARETFSPHKTVLLNPAEIVIISSSMESESCQGINTKKVALLAMKAESYGFNTLPQEGRESSFSSISPLRLIHRKVVPSKSEAWYKYFCKTLSAS